MRPSMGSVGDACDNAMGEGFFAAREREPLERRCFASQAEGRMAWFSLIRSWCSTACLHSALGYHSPMAHEAATKAATTEP